MRGSLRGRNLVDVKLSNRAAVFGNIREAGSISRSELARVTGLNPATVTHIVRELMDQGLVEEGNTKAVPRGRPRVMLRIRADRGYVIAITLSRESVRAVLTDLNMHEILSVVQRAVSPAMPVDEIARIIAELVKSVAAADSRVGDKIIGAGISAPGAFDQVGAVSVPPPSFQWSDIAFREQIEEQTGIATFIDNDANAMAMAEMWFGVARGLSNFACILADTGVGGSVVIGGDVYRGTRNAAGEIGHTTISLDGPRCDCGNVGCLELYASPVAVVASVRSAVQNGAESMLASEGFDDLSFAAVAEAAELGDALALSALQSAGQALGVGVLNLINTFDPEAVVIGGAICLAGAFILDAVREVVEQRAFTRGKREVPVIFGALKEKALITGAYCLVLKEMISNPEVSFGGSSLRLPLHRSRR